MGRDFVIANDVTSASSSERTHLTSVHAMGSDAIYVLVRATAVHRSVPDQRFR